MQGKIAAKSEKRRIAICPLLVQSTSIRLSVGFVLLSCDLLIPVRAEGITLFRLAVLI
jgi:hypothetical protein